MRPSKQERSQKTPDRLLDAVEALCDGGASTGRPLPHEIVVEELAGALLG